MRTAGGGARQTRVLCGCALPKPVEGSLHRLRRRFGAVPAAVLGTLQRQRMPSKHVSCFHLRLSLFWVPRLGLAVQFARNDAAAGAVPPAACTGFCAAVFRQFFAGSAAGLG